MFRSRLLTILCVVLVAGWIGCGSNEEEDAADSKSNDKLPATVERQVQDWEDPPTAESGKSLDPFEAIGANAGGDPSNSASLGDGPSIDPTGAIAAPGADLPDDVASPTAGSTDGATDAGTGTGTEDPGAGTGGAGTGGAGTGGAGTGSAGTGSAGSEDANGSKGDGAATDADRAGEFESQLAAFQVPPAWLDSVSSKWDMNKPWSEARQEIRRLLGQNTEETRREGIRLTWDYLQKKDIGNEHEYGMYMFLGNEPLWAVIAYRDFVYREELEYPPYFGITALASIYAANGLFEQAEKEVLRGLNMKPPKPEWNEMREAEMHDVLGDVYVAWGEVEPSKLAKARASYRAAIRVFPTAKPPYGRHLLPRRAKKVQAKLDLLSLDSLADATLKDGVYREQALGYSGDIKLTVKIQSGRIADVDIQHQEKIEQNACKLIPERIIEEQSLRVDGISGATVTADAILAGTLRALKKAGLE